MALFSVSLPAAPVHRPRRPVFMACALTLALVACGGDGDPAPAPAPSPTPAPAPSPAPEPAPTPDPTPAPTPHAGQWLDTVPGIEITASAIDAALAAGQAKVPAIPARYAVSTYRVRYLTEDADGALVQASGLVALPRKGGGEPSPVISYQHATTFENANAPSLKLEPGEPPIVLASQGYIVVAADYVGFGQSQGAPHPYLLSRPTARAVIDMIGAAQAWRAASGVADNGQLYLVGYSEGGYATMAAQREIERTGSPLRAQLQASLPAAGPYDVQATLDGLLERVRDEYPAVAWMLRPGTLKYLGDSVRAEVRRALLRLLVPDDADVRYDARFLDAYLADDRDTLMQESSVHWGWTPSAPVYLFHGRQDQTVPFAASVSALNTLRATGGAPVTLRECSGVTPTGHLPCVPEYFTYALQVMAATARGL